MITGINSPFRGKPRTTSSKTADGKPIYKVKAETLSPFRAKVADKITPFLYGFFLCSALYLAVMHMPKATGWHYAGLAVVAISSWFPIKYGLYALFKRQLHVTFTKDTIKVRRFVFPKKYDRNQQHTFYITPHPKKDQEERLLTHKEKERETHWHTRPYKRYYGDSYILKLDYMGQPIPLISIYRHKDAEIVPPRLNLCDRLLDNGSDGGQILSPDQDWTSTSGALDEHIHIGGG